MNIKLPGLLNTTIDHVGTATKTAHFVVKEAVTVTTKLGEMAGEAVVDISKTVASEVVTILCFYIKFIYFFY